MSLKQELHGGHQSRVVLATEHDGVRSRDLVIKLIDATTIDRSHVMARLQVRDRVASYDDRVVPIVPLAGVKVNRIDGCLAVASPKIDGRFLDVANRQDVERMVGH